MSKINHLATPFLEFNIFASAEQMPFHDHGYHSLSDSPPVQHQLDDTLAKTLSVGYRYVRSLKSGGSPDQTLRKCLMEAASRLLQLSMDPKEYLEQLAGNVRYICATSSVTMTNLNRTKC